MIPQSIMCLVRLIQLLSGPPQVHTDPTVTAAEPKITSEPIKYRPRDVMIRREFTKHTLARQIETQRVEP